jgi:hypothetical protein
MKRILLNNGCAFLLVFLLPSHSFAKEASGGEIKEVEWKELVKVNSSSPKAIPGLKPFLGKKVKVGGFMIANEFEQGNIKEFLLTPVGQGCSHVPPPPPNYIIHVKVADGVAVKYNYHPVLVTGKLNLTKGKENRLMHSYEMVAEAVIDYPISKK